jgi:hypothetical protein
MSDWNKRNDKITNYSRCRGRRAALWLSACTNPYDPVQRTIGGGLIGAGSGAAIGAAAAGGHGAALGAAVGGAVGAVSGLSLRHRRHGTATKPVASGFALGVRASDRFQRAGRVIHRAKTAYVS